MNQIIKKRGLVLILCLMAIWGQLVWLLGLASMTAISDSLILMAVLLTGGLLFCSLIRFASLFVTNKGLSTPNWLKTMTRILASKLGMPEPEVHTLSTAGLNAFAIDNLTRHGHVLFHQQMLSSLTHDEIEAILAHEMCHIEKGHAGVLTFMQGVMLPLSLPIALLISGLIIFFTGFGRFKSNLLQINSFLSFVLFPVTSVILLLFGRSWEYEADVCASSLVGKDQYLQALRCLHGSFFQHPNLLGAINNMQGKTKNQDGGLTHPSLAQRINALQEVGS